MPPRTLIGDASPPQRMSYLLSGTPTSLLHVDKLPGLVVNVLHASPCTFHLHTTHKMLAARQTLIREGASPLSGKNIKESLSPYLMCKQEISVHKFPLLGTPYTQLHPQVYSQVFTALHIKLISFPGILGFQRCCQYKLNNESSNSSSLPVLI